MRKRISELKLFNWNLWLSLCALALIPAVYQTVKTFLISENGQSGAFDIIGQMEWFDLINDSTRMLIKSPFKMRCPAAVCSDLRGVNSSLCINHFCTKNANLSKILQDVYSNRSRNGVKSGRGYYSLILFTIFLVPFFHRFTN